MYPQREYNKKPLPIVQPTHLQRIEDAIWKSKHSLLLEGSRVCCTSCTASVPIEARQKIETGIAESGLKP